MTPVKKASSAMVIFKNDVWHVSIYDAEKNLLEEVVFDFQSDADEFILEKINNA